MGFLLCCQLSSKLTEIQELKTTNIKLRKHLDQAMDKFELIFGEKVSLENFTEALQVTPVLERLDERSDQLSPVLVTLVLELAYWYIVPVYISHHGISLK